MRFGSAYTQLRNRPAYMATREHGPRARLCQIVPVKQASLQVGQVIRFLTAARLFITNPFCVPNTHKFRCDL
jgi:hypothetical protein